MKIKYITKKFSNNAMSIIKEANSIIKEYQKQGFDLTLRQLYYQFVSRDLIPNQQREYKRLGDIVSEARLAGLIDWDAIVDRTRGIRQLSYWNNPKEIIDACLQQYRINKWKEQPNYIEIWIEKDALSGIFQRTCKKLELGFFSCRGYTSQSEMWNAAQRLITQSHENKRITILHFGDHDPSGIDMTRDIQDRLNLFYSIEPFDEEDYPVVKRMALTIEQVDTYDPPPNPAKITDTRAKKYMSEFGNESWELDALEPTVIDEIIRNEVETLIDYKTWGQSLLRESTHKATLEHAAKAMDVD